MCNMHQGVPTARTRGAVIRSEGTEIAVLYAESTDTFLWIVDGQFMPEANVLGYTLQDQSYPAKPMTPTESLTKFDQWRIKQLPMITTHAQTGEGQKLAKLLRLNDNWQVLFDGPEGYQRCLDRLAHGGGVLPRDVLEQKRNAGEMALFTVAESFMSEFKRLGLKPLV